METPILSKKQIKTSLSAKKNRPKEKIKNVIKFPYNNYFWPEVSAEDQEELESVLAQNLSCYLGKSINIPWNELKDIPKSKRKEYRIKYAQDHNILPVKVQKPEGVLIGVNTVSKALETNSVQGILISADVQPRLLVQHIIDQAVLYKVPILCVNNLRHKIKSITGISTVCFGISKELCADPKFKLILEKIEYYFKKIPVPTTHINYNRSINSFKIQTEIIELKDEEKKEKTKINETEIRKSVYLQRPDDCSRAFIPIVEKPKVSTIEVDHSGFLAFTEEPNSEKITESLVQTKTQYTTPINRHKKEAKTKSQYKALIVKRLKGDNKRKQRKINKLKI